MTTEIIEEVEWDCFNFHGIESACEANHPADNRIRVFVAYNRVDEINTRGSMRATEILVWFTQNNLRIGAMDFSAVRYLHPVTGAEATSLAALASYMVYDGMEEIVADRDEEAFGPGNHLIVNNFEIERSVRRQGLGAKALEAFCAEARNPDSEIFELLHDTLVVLVRPYSDIDTIDDVFAEHLLERIQDSLGEPDGILLSTVPD